METTGINGFINWLANINLWQVVCISAVLFGVRMYLKQFASARAKSATETVDSALIAIVLVFLVIRPFLIQTFFIPSGSMIPTLLEKDRILVNKISYRFGKPKIGDVVVFKAPPQASPVQADFIKRLVGLPGDKLEVKDGALYRNGKRLKESCLNDDGIWYDMSLREVPKGRYFMMGDNRNNSHDSHVWGPLDQRRVIGKAMIRFWPPNRIGLIR